MLEEDKKRETHKSPEGWSSKVSAPWLRIALFQIATCLTSGDGGIQSRASEDHQSSWVVSCGSGQSLNFLDKNCILFHIYLWNGVMVFHILTMAGIVFARYWKEKAPVTLKVSRTPLLALLSTSLPSHPHLHPHAPHMPRCPYPTCLQAFPLCFPQRHWTVNAVRNVTTMASMCSVQ